LKTNAPNSIPEAIPAKAGVAFVFGLLVLASTGCSVIARRPSQEMADAAAALKAAREVQADTNSTDYFRLAEEMFFKARQEYRLKNFARAKKHAEQARELAEKAEFLSIRGGAVRSSISAPQNEVPAPAGTPVPPADGADVPPPSDAPPPTPPTAPTPSS
jgi:hypothetical protein